MHSTDLGKSVGFFKPRRSTGSVGRWLRFRRGRNTCLCYQSCCGWIRLQHAIAFDNEHATKTKVSKVSPQKSMTKGNVEERDHEKTVELDQCDNCQCTCALCWVYPACASRKDVAHVETSSAVTESPPRTEEIGGMEVLKTKVGF